MERMRPRAACVIALAVISACASPETNPGRSTGAAPPSPVATHSAVTTSRASPGSALPTVRTWLYLINVNLSDDEVRDIEASSYDLVVIDFIPSEARNTAYPIAEVVRRFHGASHPKTVLAYLDVGQAETYRTYFQPTWKVGSPDFIVGTDPDGFRGNLPVAIWRKEWKSIWLSPGGTLEKVVAAGFDGAYLDWVEGYTDADVAAAATRDRVDVRDEEVRWVADIAGRLRSLRPGAVVVPQNAVELAATDAAYRSTIDAVAQEQVWFDGGADDNPPGDCPLPRTDADVDTSGYRDGLAPGCRRLYDGYPTSSLHTSTESYLRNLTAARAAGLPVFTVDYALDRANVSSVLAQSRQNGFVPFVGTRALDRFIPPPP